MPKVATQGSCLQKIKLSFDNGVTLVLSGCTSAWRWSSRLALVITLGVGHYRRYLAGHDEQQCTTRQLGVLLMLQLSADTAILVASEPQDFRKGIDGFIAGKLQQNSRADIRFIFINRNRTMSEY